MEFTELPCTCRLSMMIDQRLEFALASALSESPGQSLTWGNSMKFGGLVAVRRMYLNGFLGLAIFIYFVFQPSRRVMIQEWLFLVYKSGTRCLLPLPLEPVTTLTAERMLLTLTLPNRLATTIPWLFREPRKYHFERPFFA